jgi:AAA family ATPase
MTEGYSGAEIKGACATAGRAALGRYQQDPSAAALGITMEDLETAVASHRQQITEEMLSGYTEWESQFRGY